MTTDESPLVEDLEVRNQERRGGKYHRIVDSSPVIKDGVLETDDGEWVQALQGKEVKIESEKLTLYREKTDEQFTLYHIYVRDEPGSSI